MAELIALLLALVGQFGQANLSAEEFSKQISESVMVAQPVPLKAVHAEATLSLNGELNSLVFKLDGLVLDPLKIEHASIMVEGIEIDPQGKVSLGSIDWTVEINDADLTAALQKHTGSITQAVISSSKQGLIVEGSYKLWRLRIPFSLEGQLVVENQTNLVFELDSSGIGKLKLPLKLNKLLEQEINPVYDLGQFSSRSKEDLDQAKAQLNYEFYLLVEKIAPQKGKIVVNGSA